MSFSLFSCRLLLGFVTACYCKHHPNCVNSTVFENTRINITCEDFEISEKECHMDVVSGYYVAPTYLAIQDVQRKCSSERKREVAWNATYDSNTGGYLVVYPEDPSWSTSLCKVVLVKSDGVFSGTFRTYFQTTSTLFPNVQPMWKIQTEKEWVSSLLISNSVTPYLNISFEVQTCKQFHYDIELWKSGGKLRETKKVTKNFAVFLDLNPGSYFAKIKVHNAGTCHCFINHRCKHYEDLTTDVFIHPSQWRTEKTEDRSVPVTLVYAVTTVMALTFFGMIVAVALTVSFKAVSARRFKKTREKAERSVILYAANENKCHKKAVVDVQRNISSICKQQVSCRFVEPDVVHKWGNFKVPKKSNTLLVIILSKSLFKCMQRSEDLSVMKTSEIVFVNLVEDCEITGKIPLSKMMHHQDNITTFHLPKDTVKFYNFISIRFQQKRDTKNPLTAEKGRNLEEALSQRMRSRQKINPSAPRLVPEKPRPRALSNQSFDSISQVIAVNKTRKYRCTKRMLGFQLTSNGSEHIVLPGQFTYTNEDIASGLDNEELICLSADETADVLYNGVEERSWQDTSPKYNRCSANPQGFSLLPDSGLIPEEMEAVSIGGKSV